MALQCEISSQASPAVHLRNERSRSPVKPGHVLVTSRHVTSRHVKPSQHKPSQVKPRSRRARGGTWVSLRKPKRATQSMCAWQHLACCSITSAPLRCFGVP
eukprot:3488685-Rhodomonas_salina.2